MTVVQRGGPRTRRFGVVVGILAFVGLLLCILPGLAVLLFSVFVYYVALDQGQAVRRYARQSQQSSHVLLRGAGLGSRGTGVRGGRRPKAARSRPMIFQNFGVPNSKTGFTKSMLRWL